MKNFWPIKASTVGDDFTPSDYRDASYYAQRAEAYSRMKNFSKEEKAKRAAFSRKSNVANIIEVTDTGSLFFPSK